MQAPYATNAPHQELDLQLFAALLSCLAATGHATMGILVVRAARLHAQASRLHYVNVTEAGR